MNIWLLKDGEPLACDPGEPRIMRTGLLAQQLSLRGHEVTWWTSSFDHYHKKQRVEHTTQQHIQHDYSIIMLRAPGYQRHISPARIRHNQVVAKQFRHHAAEHQRPDLLFVALPMLELAAAAVDYATQHNIPVIVDLRDMWPDIMVDILPQQIQKLGRIALHGQFKMMRRICRQATALTGITERFLDWGLSYAQRPRQADDGVFPIGYPDNPQPLAHDETMHQFWQSHGISVDHDDFLLIYLGSITRSIELGPVIDAVKQLGHKVKLVIAGRGGYTKQYQQQAANCERIIFPGWLDKNQIQYLLRCATVGMAPYINRKDFQASISNKAAEYLSAGLPIITSVNGSLNELLQQYQCGFHYPGKDTTALVKLITDLQANPSLIKCCSQQARKLYEDQLNAKNIYTNLCHYLEGFHQSVDSVIP